MKRFILITWGLFSIVFLIMRNYFHIFKNKNIMIYIFGSVYIINILLAFAAESFAREKGKPKFLWGILSFFFPYAVPFILVLLKKTEVHKNSVPITSNKQNLSYPAREIFDSKPEIIQQNIKYDYINFIKIPDITKKHLSVNFKESKTLGQAGPGGELFQEAVQDLNNRNFDEAEKKFIKAVDSGLDQLRTGYANANLGIIRFNKKDIQGSLYYFMKVLNQDQALYESVHDTAQYLHIIYSELGKKDCADILNYLVSFTNSKLGYSLSPDAAQKIKVMIQSEKNKSITSFNKSDNTKEEQKKAAYEIFNNIQTTSASEATKIIFEKPEYFLPPKNHESIQNAFEIIKDSWRSEGLIEGNKQELQKIVSSNLEQTTKEYGFQYFTINLNKQLDCFQVIVWSNGDGVSICLWRSADKFYLCGNYYFKK